MSSSSDNKTCGLCSSSPLTWRNQAMFTSECSHCFHFSCFSNYVSHGDRFCPTCYTQWEQPLTSPLPTTNAFRQLHNPAFQYPTPVYHQPPPEPLQFCDDEPISDPTSIDSLDSQRVGLRAIPERPSLAASQSESLFAVLVGLKAPSLSDDRRAPVDIVAVLDVSYSMEGKKMALMKKAVEFVIDNLGDSDRLSIVSFSSRITRVLPLRRMTESGRDYAKRAVASLVVSGGTNIVGGLKKGARVLEERRHRNPVSSIVFLSDGNDTDNQPQNLEDRHRQGFLHLLPPSICPRNRGLETEAAEVFPVHSFGFGSDHDPVTMHGISDASGGTFSFIESIEMVQDAFASCIGGLLSVVVQDLRLSLRSASHGVEIKSIPSGRCRSDISNQRSEGVINVGDLYADEEKEFLINLSIPTFLNNNEDRERKTSLLDITCSYRDAVSKQTVVMEGELVEIRRPEIPTTEDMAVNLEVDRQRSRLHAAEIIRQAQEMAEAGNLPGARNILAKKRIDLMGSASAQAGDVMIKWLEGEMEESEMRMGSENMYLQSGRAYVLAGMSSHAAQRATTRGSVVGGAAAYATPQMANMVSKSRQQNLAGEGNTASMEEL